MAAAVARSGGLCTEGTGTTPNEDGENGKERISAAGAEQGSMTTKTFFSQRLFPNERQGSA